MQFRWDETVYETVARPLFAEIDHVEQLTGRSEDEWSRTMQARVGVYWAVRRVDPTRLSWEQLGQLALDDFVPIDEPAGDAVPPAQTGEPSPSSLPDTPAEVVDSQPTDAPTIS